MILTVKWALASWTLVSCVLRTSAFGFGWGSGMPMFHGPRDLDKVKDILNNDNEPMHYSSRNRHNYCTENGVFVVPGSCREFYFCEYQRSELIAFRFSCPLDTLFDDDVEKCVSPLSIGRPECRDETLTDGTPSVDQEPLVSDADDITTDNKRHSNNACSSNMFESLSQCAREACENTHNIDVYIRDMMSKHSLQLSSNAKEFYRGNFFDYDRDLENALSNCREWRHGDSLFNALKQSFLLAKEFEIHLNKKFEETKERVEEIRKVHTLNLTILEEDITDLQIEISETQDSQSSQNTLIDLQEDLKNKQNALEEFTTNYEKVKTEKELDELIVFLEFVRGTIADIQENALNTASKVERFQEEITRDLNVFLKHEGVAQESVDSLQDEKRSYEREMVHITNIKKSLQVKKNQDSSLIANVRKVIQTTERELRDLENKLTQKRRNSRNGEKMRRYVHRGFFSDHGLDNIYKLVNQKRSSLYQSRRQVDSFYSHINILDTDLQVEDYRFSNINKKFQTLETELFSFGQLEKDLASLKKDIDSIIPSTNGTMLSIGRMKDVFDDMRQKVDDIIEVAKSGQEEVDGKDLITFIYDNIADLLCMWDKGSIRIVTIGDCN